LNGLDVSYQRPDWLGLGR